MSTKGKTNLYGHTKGSNKNNPSRKINFKYAKKFNCYTLHTHLKYHKKEFNTKYKEEYEARAIKFANKIDHYHCKSLVDYQGTTFKYNIKTKEFVMVTKDGVIITYHHKDKFYYYTKKGEKIWVNIN